MTNDKNTRDAAVDRARKLLELAKGGTNENESAAALAAANRIIAQHGIEAAMLDTPAPEADEDIENFRTDPLDASMRQRVVWRSMLANVLANANAPRLDDHRVDEQRRLRVLLALSEPLRFREELACSIETLDQLAVARRPRKLVGGGEEIANNIWGDWAVSVGCIPGEAQIVRRA